MPSKAKIVTRYNVHVLCMNLFLEVDHVKSKVWIKETVLRSFSLNLENLLTGLGCLLTLFLSVLKLALGFLGVAFRSVKLEMLS